MPLLNNTSQAMDMLSAGHQDWARLRKKKQQAHQLEQQQQRVVAAAFGCDPAAAAAALAALSAGLPVQQHLEGAVSVSPRPFSAAAVAGLDAAGTGPLQDAAAAQELIEAADKLTSELAFWEDSTALKAWLQLRSGQLAAAAQTAESQPNKYLAAKPHHSSSEWGWRWWVLAQVKWQQGDLAAAKALLQQGQGMLQKATSQGSSSDGGNSSSGSGSTSLWLLLLPSLQELSELLQQVQQLLALKESGNAAIQAKQYEKAAEEYSKALALQPSCGFAAVIHSNRAAALQQQQRLIEALADCSRAVALDPKYARAYLRCVACRTGRL
jgi:tetratricopeptide (TPR) repeat protein